MIEQRSNDWFELRRGRATASEIHKIMGIKGFGETGESYTFEKACEIVFGLPEEKETTNKDLIRGTELEPFAFAKFQEIKDNEFLDVTESEFILYNDYSGASPDGLVSDNSNLEIKCPQRNNFFKIIALGKDAIKKDYLYQMQFQMMATNTNKTYFFNYCIDKGIEMWHELQVFPDEKIIKKIDERLLMFFEKREEYIHKINTNKQFNI